LLSAGRVGQDPPPPGRARHHGLRARVPARVGRVGCAW